MMKSLYGTGKILLFIALTTFTFIVTDAQNVVNGVLQGSPTTFMILPQTASQCNSPTSWVKTKYTTSSPGNNYDPCLSGGTYGVTGWGSNNFSHKFVVRNANGTSPTDCNACYGVPGFYSDLPVLPLAWNSNEYTDGAYHYVDSVIQVGCDESQGRKSNQVEYTFIPDTINPVLMLTFMIVLENIDNSQHGYNYNPRIKIEVTNANTGQLLPLGYYPNDYLTNGNANLGTAPSNNNWPYARYYFISPGSSTSVGGGESEQITPSALSITPDICPQNEICNPSWSYSTSITSYQHRIVAYNLIEQARSHTPVKLRVMSRSCNGSAHWAYLYYTAKMVPGSITVDACGDNDIVLSVPWGFEASSYEWYAGVDENSATYQGGLDALPGFPYNLVLNRNNLPNGMRLYPYYCCKMTSQTGVPFKYEAHLKIYDLHPQIAYQQEIGDCDYSFSFDDDSYIATLVPAAVSGYDTTYLDSWSRDWTIFDAQGNVEYHLQNTDHFNYTFPDNSPRNIRLIIADPNGACNPDTVTLPIEFDDAYVQPASGLDTIITCEENLPVVFDQATFGEQYTWHDAGTREVVYPAARWNGCDSTVHVTVIVQKPVAQVAQGDDFCDAFATTLTADANVTVVEYKWNNSETTQNITVTTPGTYSVTITDEGGCQASASVSIAACKPFVNLPNAITPSDHNGLNDCVEVVQRNLIKELEFSVFNRNGELVYTTTDKNFCWDGRDEKHNKLYVNATYNWILKIVDYDGYKQMFRGSITVL